MNHSCSAYTAITGSVCLGNLQKPFVSTLRLHRELSLLVGVWEEGNLLDRAAVGLGVGGSTTERSTADMPINFFSCFWSSTNRYLTTGYSLWSM